MGEREVMEYQKDFSVPVQQAEDALEVQDTANEVGLVGELEGRLAQRYAGIWFDNEKGEYVVPTLPSTNAAAVDSEFDQVGLNAADFRISSAHSSWVQLQEAHQRIDATLLPEIEEGFVETSLDPRTNAVVITQTAGASAEVRSAVQQVVAESPVEVEIRPIDLQSFDDKSEACSESFCDAPLRGGVKINPPGEPSDHCTAGFPATGVNGSRYIVTAGHCVELYPGAPLLQYWESKDSALQPHYIGIAEQWEHEWFDWAKIRVEGSAWNSGPWSPEIAYWGEPIIGPKGEFLGKKPPVNLDYPIIGEAANVTGNYACHTGIMTGTSCGYISGTEVTHKTAEHVTYGLNKLANACSIPGDSGGPYFMGHSALGLHVDSQNNFACGDTLYYTDILRATAALHVSIAPQASWHTDNLGGNVTSDSDIASWASNRLDVFTRGTNNVLCHKVWEPSSGWTAWEQLPGPTLASGPGAVSWGPGRVDVVARIADGSVEHWGYQSGQGWTYENLGGNIVGDPDIASWESGRLDVFARGTDDGLFHKSWDPTHKWSVWEKVYAGTNLTSGPGAVSWGPGRLDVVARVAGNTVGHWSWGGAGWSFENLGGNITADPDISSWEPGRVDIFARGTDNGLFHRSWTGNWSVWEPIPGPALASGPGAVSWGPGRIDVVGKAADGTVSHWYWSP
jgi:hypothetical protein